MALNTHKIRNYLFNNFFSTEDVFPIKVRWAKNFIKAIKQSDNQVEIDLLLVSLEDTIAVLEKDLKEWKNELENHPNEDDADEVYLKKQTLELSKSAAILYNLILDFRNLVKKRQSKYSKTLKSEVSSTQDFQTLFTEAIDFE